MMRHLIGAMKRREKRDSCLQRQRQANRMSNRAGGNHRCMLEMKSKTNGHNGRQKFRAGTHALAQTKKRSHIEIKQLNTFAMTEGTGYNATTGGTQFVQMLGDGCYPKLLDHHS
ncbi:hypothetical protein HBI56_069420 [Parastagonospora nodorum]|uniref:Uncharacterized protein n=1 Tax=Phaeosphaeria nodorum (strain SN15 / ATCC MYA-4574 / FGSC 10173) TaxID=321614 RepID=A0A7U2HSJ4_PHANO|nr:hypothetical protein HBH56_003860 [Parastagonospora nodorum]QRC90300.1 hypothetical protein JI435_400330 [Parastagonospora nodorum SN15]KAH3938031.1 hypothetical protein HBH54_003850 [Parastagonospora nodorum]KAH3946700.1 hypothetical protein HBH53_128130 [Parastagonospora nodorum]KAH3975112.1 hypothetical protein HBH51_086620 [Parastagonospora nodorum]